MWNKPKPRPRPKKPLRLLWDMVSPALHWPRRLAKKNAYIVNTLDLVVMLWLLVILQWERAEWDKGSQGLDIVELDVVGGGVVWNLGPLH